MQSIQNKRVLPLDYPQSSCSHYKCSGIDSYSFTIKCFTYVTLHNPSFYFHLFQWKNDNIAVKTNGLTFSKNYIYKVLIGITMETSYASIASLSIRPCVASKNTSSSESVLWSISQRNRTLISMKSSMVQKKVSLNRSPNIFNQI